MLHLLSRWPVKQWWHFHLHLGCWFVTRLCKTSLKTNHVSECPAPQLHLTSTWGLCIIDVQCYFCFMSSCTRPYRIDASLYMHKRALKHNPTPHLPCYPLHCRRHVPLWTHILWRVLKLQRPILQNLFQKPLLSYCDVNIFYVLSTQPYIFIL